MKKKVLSLLFASVAAACTVCGCGGGSSGSIIILDGETTGTRKSELTFYGHRNDNSSLGVIESVLKSYISETDTDVCYEGAAEALYWNSLDRRYISGNLDDVFMIDRDRLLAMSGRGALAELDDAVNENIFNDFARGQLRGSDGKIYAVPAGISTYGLYVNYGLLEKHSKRVPSNFAEFSEVCDYFRGAGIPPVVSNNSSSLRSLILAKGMYNVYCTENTSAEIEKFNADPVTLSAVLNDGIDFVYCLIENGWIDLEETALNEQLSDDLELFAEGERPFMFTGGWASVTLKDMLAKSDKTLSYGIHPYPVSQSASVLVAQASPLISVKKGENEADAKKLLSMLSGGAALSALNEGQSCFSPLRGQTQIYADSAIIPSASYLSNGKYVISSDNNLKIPLDNYLDECAALVCAGESADTVKARLAELLKNYKADEI